MFRIMDVSIAVNDLLVVKNVSLSIESGEIHILMGPNGAGKSSLLKAIMGLSQYRIIRGAVLIDGRNITKEKPYERAKLGIALAHQNPPKLRVRSKYLLSKLINLYQKDKPLSYINDLAREFNVGHLLSRELYSNFSGGEAKRFELLTVVVQRPKVCLLDEPDSGVDIDSIRKIALIVSRLAEKGTGILLVTHTGYLIKYLSRVDTLYIMVNGKIVYRGDESILPKLIEKGYQVVDNL